MKIVKQSSYYENNVSYHNKSNYTKRTLNINEVTQSKTHIVVPKIRVCVCVCV